MHLFKHSYEYVRKNVNFESLSTSFTKASAERVCIIISETKTVGLNTRQYEGIFVQLSNDVEFSENFV